MSLLPAQVLYIALGFPQLILRKNDSLKDVINYPQLRMASVDPARFLDIANLKLEEELSVNKSKVCDRWSRFYLKESKVPFYVIVSSYLRGYYFLYVKTVSCSTRHFRQNRA